MEQIPQLELYCLQLHEDGLLEQVPTESGVVEYQLTDTGRSIVTPKILRVSPTKYTIFQQLRKKEDIHARLGLWMYTTIQNSPHYLSLLQLQDLAETPLTLPVLSSVLYGLLYHGKITACGPLYGPVVPI